MHCKVDLRVVQPNRTTLEIWPRTEPAGALMIQDQQLIFACHLIGTTARTLLRKDTVPVFVTVSPGMASDRQVLSSEQIDTYRRFLFCPLAFHL